MSAETDRELQDYLDGKSPLSAKYREASREAAPPELDAAVLGFAREELKTQATPSVAARGRTVRRSRRWTIPLATAATMLLGLNLVWQLRDESVPTAEQAAPAARSAAVTEPQAAPPVEAGSETKKAKRPAIEPREQTLEARARAKPQSAPAPAAELQDGDASAPAADAMGGAAFEAAPAPQPAVAEVLSEPAVKQEQVPMQAARAAEREEMRQSEARSDSAKLQRERKSSAASGFAAAAPARVQAYVPVPPASEVADQTMEWLRKEDYAAIRAQLLAKDLDQQMLIAAAAVAKTIDPTTEPEFSSVDEDLWRVDYRGAEQRCTMLLQRTPAGWMLLQISVADE